MTARGHHAGRLSPEHRLWPSFELLRRRGSRGATSRELMEAQIHAGREVLNSGVVASDLRKMVGLCGYRMPRARRERATDDDAKVYRYELVREEPTDRAPPPADPRTERAQGVALASRAAEKVLAARPTQGRMW